MIPGVGGHAAAGHQAGVGGRALGEQAEIDVIAALNLRSEYDSTQVLIDGSVVTTLPSNTAGDLEIVQIPVTQNATLDVMASGFKGGVDYDTPVKSTDVYLLGAPQHTYTNDFNSPSSDFQGSGFSIRAETGFPDDAIHTAHNYPDGQTATYLLTVPIKIGASGVTLSFDEVAIVEPGDPG